MIDLSYYVAAVGAVPGIAQVIQPERVTSSDVDTSALLAGLIGPAVSNRVYPYHLPATPVYPSVTYEQTGSQRKDVDGYIITSTDIFMISIQAETLADIITTVDAVRAALIGYKGAGVAGGIDIADQAVTWHNDIKRYEAAMEVHVTHMASLLQATPAYYLYPVDEQASENRAMNAVSQMVAVQFVGLLVAQMPVSGVYGINALRDAVYQKIINAVPGSGATRTERVGSNVAGLVGSVVLWRDVFSVAYKSHYI
ncbi:MAG: hypothetical protein M0Q95_11020 [Porticoccaceae bacterium]|nr:hypothetical protein [Porticoccaceae bacterium]